MTLDLCVDKLFLLVFFPTSFACKLGVETGTVLVASGTKQLSTVADDLDSIPTGAGHFSFKNIFIWIRVRAATEP